MSLRIGSLCSGYGGLDAAAQAVIGGEHAWMAENDPHASKVLAHHWPAVPNLGDITAIGWTSVEPVDVIVAGTPCTNISNAGHRDGINGTASRVWKNAAEAIGVLRPRLVVLENVAAIRSRGLDTVTADLAAIGYMATWTYTRASDEGAPHQRHRWFCIAHPAAADAHHGGELDHTATYAASGLALLPTPKASDGPNGGPNQRDAAGHYYLPGIAVRLDERWIAEDGTDYNPAVRRWESVTGRPVPEPTALTSGDKRRLSPAFVEWMMGVTPGHVTSVPDLTRSHQIRVLGGGVVPRQGVAAIESLMPEIERRAAA